MGVRQKRVQRSHVCATRACEAPAVELNMVFSVGFPFFAPVFFLCLSEPRSLLARYIFRSQRLRIAFSAPPNATTPFSVTYAKYLLILILVGLEPTQCLRVILHGRSMNQSSLSLAVWAPPNSRFFSLYPAMMLRCKGLPPNLTPFGR